jgi:hypothetical protein
MEKTVILNEFQDFPQMSIGLQANLVFNHYSKHQSIKDVNDTRMDYFA